MYQNAGEKGLEHTDPLDPPRRRANKWRGHGNWDNDGPPVVGVIGRESHQVALQVRATSGKAELRQRIGLTYGFVGISGLKERYLNSSDCLRTVVQSATQPNATVNTDEWRGYDWLDQTEHPHKSVNHNPANREWARDDDGDGVREVHTNTIEGFWTDLRNFLRPFRGVSKHYLADYVAVYAWTCNFKNLTIIHLLRCLMVPFTSIPS